MLRLWGRLSARLAWGLSLGLLSGVMLGLGMGTAQAAIIECRLRRGQGAEGLIAPQYLFDHAPGSVTAQVYDGLIKARMSRPQVARVAEEVTRLTFRWEVRTSDTWGNPVDVSFRARLDLSGAISLEARIAGDLQAEGEGFCAAH
jgi:hypothetical protein